MQVAPLGPAVSALVPSAGPSVAAVPVRHLQNAQPAVSDVGVARAATVTAVVPPLPLTERNLREDATDAEVEEAIRGKWSRWALVSQAAPTGPGVYELGLKWKGEIVAIYAGQSADLRVRMNSYAPPTYSHLSFLHGVAQRCESNVFHRSCKTTNPSQARDFEARLLNSFDYMFNDQNNGGTRIGLQYFIAMEIRRQLRSSVRNSMLTEDEEGQLNGMFKALCIKK